MPKPVIVTADSSADLPPEIREEFGIHFIPIYIQVEGRQGQDCVDIFPGEIYDAFRLRGSLPKTAAPPIAQYKDFFEQFTARGAAVVHIALSGKFSSCKHIAELAAGETEGEVYVADSMNFCTGQGMLAIQAAKLRDQGLPAAELARELEQLRAKVRAFYFLDGVTFLAKSGRAPMIAAMGAKLLNLHPAITIDGANSEIIVGKKYRGKNAVAAEAWLRDSIMRFRELCDPSLTFFMHTPEMPLSQYGPMEAVAQAELPQAGRLVMGPVGCSVVSHVGGNCYALVGMEKA